MKTNIQINSLAKSIDSKVGDMFYVVKLAGSGDNLTDVRAEKDLIEQISRLGGKVVHGYTVSQSEEEKP